MSKKIINKIRVKILELNDLNKQIAKEQGSTDFIKGITAGYTEILSFLDTLEELKTGKDSILFPIEDVYDLASTLVNLSDEGFHQLDVELEREYGRNIKLPKTQKNTLEEPEMDLEEAAKESWRMKYQLWKRFTDIDEASYQYIYDVSNDWAQEKPTWEQVQDSFKTGAKWMAEQGETIEDEVGICQDAEMTPLIEVGPKTFKVGDKVIVQIRKR